jgi:hypothetical protein
MYSGKPSWAEGLTDKDIEALQSAIKDAEQELTDGKEPTKFYQGKSTLVQSKKNMAQRKAYETPHDVFPLVLSSRESSDIKVAESFPKKEEGVISRMTNFFSGKKEKKESTTKLKSTLLDFVEHQGVRSLQLPRSYDEFYPLDVATKDAKLYIELLNESDILDKSIDGEGGGGMSREGMVAQNLSINILELGVSIILTLMHRNVWRSFKIYREPHTREKSIEPYHGLLPNTTTTAHNSSQHYFEYYCKNKKKKFEKMLKNEAEKATNREGAAVSSADTVPKKVRFLPELSTSTSTSISTVKSFVPESDDVIVEELLSQDPPEIHPTEHLYGDISPTL